jgi:hypothetical protein
MLSTIINSGEIIKTEVASKKNGLELNANFFKKKKRIMRIAACVTICRVRMDSRILSEKIELRAIIVGYKGG